MTDPKRRLLVWAGLLLSLGFGYLAVRDVDFAGVRDALGRQDYVWLGPAALALAVAVALRAWRWQLLFTAEDRPPYRAVSAALLVGYFFNSVLPARAGELARVQVLGTRAGISRAHVLATVVLERLYDLLALVLLLAVAAPFLPSVGWLRAALILGLALALALAAVGVVLRRRGVAAARPLLRPLALMPGFDEARVDRAAASVVSGLTGVSVTRVAAVSLLITTVSWLVLAASGWFLLLGTEIDEGFAAALLVLIATNLVLVLPSSPAGLGAFEAAGVVALAAFGVGKEEALSYALVLHALNLVPSLVAGYVVLSLQVRGSGASRRHAARKPRAGS